MTQGRRKWTPEQKAAASLAGKERMAKKWMESRNKITMGSPFEPGAMVGTSEAPCAVVEAPAMVPWTPEEAEKRGVVAAEMHGDRMPDDPKYLDVVKEVPAIRDVVRVGSREVVLRVRTDGQMVSLQGPCLCGAVKREWHQICLKQDSK